MSIPTLGSDDPAAEHPGWAHVAITLGSPVAVDVMVARMDALDLLRSPPRWAGDGFFEAVIDDPEGNLIEITA